MPKTSSNRQIQPIDTPLLPTQTSPSSALGSSLNPGQLTTEPLEGVGQRRNLWRLIQAPTGNEDIDCGNLLNIFQGYYDNPVTYVAEILGRRPIPVG
jgi:hypothetical protein